MSVLTISPAGPHLAVEPDAARLVVGRPPEEAALLLARLYNLCGAAQGMAARLAFGLEPAPEAAEQLAQEIRRDHLAKIYLSWPKALGLAPQALPAGWRSAAPDLWGGEVPQRLAPWLLSGRGVSPVLAALQRRFGAGEAVVARAPFTDIWRFEGENSPASRHAPHPLMRQAEAAFGQGPFWRALGRVVDAMAAPAAPQILPDGTVVVPASRGAYGLRATLKEGHVRSLARVTPTDHLLGSGLLAQSLAGLKSFDKAPLLLEILDPCVPWAVQAEVLHA